MGPAITYANNCEIFLLRSQMFPTQMKKAMWHIFKKKHWLTGCTPKEFSAEMHLVLVRGQVFETLNTLGSCKILHKPRERGLIIWKKFQQITTKQQRWDTKKSDSWLQLPRCITVAQWYSVCKPNWISMLQPWARCTPSQVCGWGLIGCNRLNPYKVALS